jgi:hypothetical protein
MADAAPFLDELVKEYFLFRGFTATLKTFENEIKADKDKSFRVSAFRANCGHFKGVRDEVPVKKLTFRAAVDPKSRHA